MIRYRVLLVSVVLMGLGFAIVLGPAPTGAAPSQPQVVLDLQRGLPGTTIRVTPQTETADKCSAAWDSDPAVVFYCGPNDSNGQLGSTMLTVPISASPGTHSITVCQPQCDSVNPVRKAVEPVWTAAVPFTVTTVVPDLANLSVDQARNLLSDAHLRLGNVTGPTDDLDARIVFQTLDAYSVVDPGSAVDVRVAGGPVSQPATSVGGTVTSPPPLPGSGVPAGSAAARIPSNVLSWRSERIAAILTGAGLLLFAVIGADAAARRKRRRRARRRRQSQICVRSGSQAHSVTIRNTGRSATRTAEIVSHRHSTVTFGKAL